MEADLVIKKRHKATTKEKVISDAGRSTRETIALKNYENQGQFDFVEESELPMYNLSTLHDTSETGTYYVGSYVGVSANDKPS